MKPGEDLYDAKIKVLSEQIDHHVKEEESEMFPKARKAELDLVALGDGLQGTACLWTVRAPTARKNKKPLNLKGFLSDSGGDEVRPPQG